MRKIIAILLTSSILTPAISYAASEEIIVTAGRKAQKQSQIGQSTAVIDEEAIKKSNAKSVVELLQNQTGVIALQNGPIGSVASVKIRGAQGYQTLTLIDGVKLYDPSSPQNDFNLGTLMVGNISRVEIVRGAQSVLWGSQAIGGVVNLITKAPTSAPNYNAMAEYGANNTSNFGANASGKIGALSASLGANYLNTDGFSAFNKARGGKEKDGHENKGANAKLTFDIGQNLSLDLRGIISDSSSTFDGATSDTLDSQTAKLGIGYFGANYKMFDGKLQNQLGYSNSQSKRHYNYPAWFATYDYTGKTDRFSYLGNLNLTNEFGIVFGAESEKIDYIIDNGFSVDKQNSKTTSIFAQANFNPIEPLNINIGLRNDNHSQFGDHNVFDINGTYAFNNGNTLIRASYGEGYRAPSLYELFDVWSGDKNLRPETAQTQDIGILQKFMGGKLQLSAAYFNVDSTNLIDYSPIFFRYMQIGKAQSKGYELEAKFAPNEKLNFAFNHTYTDAKDLTNNVQLARRPKNSSNLIVNYAFTNGLSAQLSAHYASSSLEYSFGSLIGQRVAGYVFANVNISQKISQHIDIYANIHNVTNENYETILNYGTQRRAFTVGLRVNY